MCHESEDEYSEDSSVHSEEEEKESPPHDPREYFVKVGYIITDIIGLTHYNYRGTLSDGDKVFLYESECHPLMVLDHSHDQIGHIDDQVARVLLHLRQTLTIEFFEGVVPEATLSPSNNDTIPFHIPILADEDFRTLKSYFSDNGLKLFPIDDDDAKSGILDKLFGHGLRKLEALEAPKHVIKAQLYLHQKEALFWMVERERSEDLLPFWKEENDGSFSNILNDSVSKIRPVLRGGIFADESDLGKTLSLLSLIGSDKVVNEEDGSVTENPCSDFVRKTTLIVCPDSVYSDWLTQIEEHCFSGSFRVYQYNGKDRTDDFEVLRNNDIVLTTYSTLLDDDSKKRKCSAVDRVVWWRVIYDEAHELKSMSGTHKAVTNLQAQRMWVVTGTPIQEDQFDLFSLMSLLRLQQSNLESLEELSHLQVLMETISLRRTKDNGLIVPLKTVENYYVEFSKEELQLYNIMEEKAKHVFQDYVDSECDLSKLEAVITTLLQLRQLCIDLGLCASNIKSKLLDENIEDMSNRPKLLKKMFQVLKEGEDYNCPICYYYLPQTDLVTTRCHHTFCLDCILKCLKKKNTCPMCRRIVQQSELVTPAAPETSDTDDAGPSSSKENSSLKVSSLLQLLEKSRNENPATKSVVFSQFHKMLMLLVEPLEVAGFRSLSLDGTFNEEVMAKLIREFGDPGPDAPTVLLASHQALGMRINLTAASRVYFLEPWWNAALENQAVDRVHRIGQKEEVKIVRIIARDTIEERILKFQKKRQDCNGGQDPGFLMEFDDEDLGVLMS